MPECKLWFLIPEDFLILLVEFANTLKNAAENRIESETNAGEGWAMARTVEHSQTIAEREIRITIDDDIYNICTIT